VVQRAETQRRIGNFGVLRLIQTRHFDQTTMKLRPIAIAAICITLACVGLANQVIMKTALTWIPQHITGSVVRIGASLLLMEAARLLVLAFYKPQGGMRRDNFTAGMAHLTKIVYALSIVVLLLSLFDVSVKEAITSLSLIAAAIVLMTKDYISNLINGMYITFTKLVNIGDNVKIAEHKGKILDITLTNVHLLNDDDDIIYIPNNIVFTSEIINFTRRELKKSYVDFEVQTQDLVPQAELEKAIIDGLGALNELIQPGSHYLKVASIKFEYTSFKFQFILNDPLNKEHDRKVRRHIAQFVVAFIAKKQGSRV
jgi:small-conductance mechanosensitive channel